MLRLLQRSGISRVIFGLSILAVAALTTAGVAGVGRDVAAAGSSSTNHLGVYVGYQSPGGVSSFGRSIGTQPTFAMDFLDGDSWSALVNTAPSYMSAWQGSGYTMIWGLPMLPNSGSTLAEGATGAYNSYFLQLAQEMVAGGQGSSIVRPGWEFNGGWFSWAANGQASAFVTYWQQIVTTMRSVPGQNFTFEWNPTAGDTGVGDLANYYPGNAYVDDIGLDLYDQEWGTYAGIASEWNNDLTEPYGLDWLVSFAAAEGKPITLPEWGLDPDPSSNDGGVVTDAQAEVGGGDDPAFINDVAQWIAQNHVYEATYWQYNSSLLSSGSNPNSFAAFVQDFGSGAGSTTSSTNPGSSSASTGPPVTTTSSPTTTGSSTTTSSSTTTTGSSTTTTGSSTTTSPPTTTSAPTTTTSLPATTTSSSVTSTTGASTTGSLPTTTSSLPTTTSSSSSGSGAAGGDSETAGSEGSPGPSLPTFPGTGQSESSVTIQSPTGPVPSWRGAHFSAVIRTAPSGKARPTGPVSWSIRSRSGVSVPCRLGSNVINRSIRTTHCNVAAGVFTAADGPYTVSVSYSGGSGVAASSASVTQPVAKAKSRTLLRRPAFVPAGSLATVMAVVVRRPHSKGTAAGTVTFAVSALNGSGQSPSCAGGDTVSLWWGAARCDLTDVGPAGSAYTVTATYSGDGTFGPSTSDTRTIRVR